MSAPDTVGLINRSERLKEIFDRSREKYQSKKKQKDTQQKILGVFPISSRTYYDFRKGRCVDIFPLVENPEDFGILQKINKPVLMILAEKDSVIVRGRGGRFRNIKRKSYQNVHDFTGIVIEECNTQIYT